MNYLLPLCPKFIKLRYENKIWITRSCVPFGSDACFAQRKLKKVEPGEASKNRLAEIYADSLLMCRQRIDSMKMDSGDSRYAQLFTPLTFYHGLKQPACCDSSLRMG